MGFGNISTPKNTSEQSTQTTDARIAAADQGVALRGDNGSQQTINYSIQSADTQLLKDLAAGAASLTTTLAGNQSKIASDAISSISGLQSTNLSGGATDLQKTILIGLGIGVGGIVLIKLLAPKGKIL